MSEIEQAIEVFVRGFAFTRSVTHPYGVERIESVWVARDAPRRSGDYRNEEWITSGISPAKVDRLARRHKIGRYFICFIRELNDDEKPIRDEFRRLKYRLLRTEPFMIHRLKRIPRFTTSHAVERVRTQELADRLAKAARGRQILPEHLKDDAQDGTGLRQYVVMDGQQIIGWARSIVVGRASWLSSVHVDVKYRRQGIGRALLARLLNDDRAAGIERSVLLASHAGALLYPVVGYEPIGELLLYAPPRR